MARYAERRRRLYRRPTAQFTKFEGQNPADTRPRPRGWQDLPGEQQELESWEAGPVTEKEAPLEETPLVMKKTPPERATLQERETKQEVYSSEILSQAKEEEKTKVREKLERMSMEELQDFHAQNIMKREVAEMTGKESTSILTEIEAAEEESFARASKIELEEMMEEYPYFSREMLDFMNKHGDGKIKNLVYTYRDTFLELLANERELRVMLKNPESVRAEWVVAKKHRRDELKQEFEKLTDKLEAEQFNLIVPKDAEGKFRKMMASKLAEQDQGPKKE